MHLFISFVSNINRYLYLDSTLADFQHGIWSHRSCEIQLVQFVHIIISKQDLAKNRGHKQICSYMILQKTFVKVPNRRLFLVHKLEQYGIKWLIQVDQPMAL